MSHDQLFDTALSLPQSKRADLAFQLLQSLDPPGEEFTTDEFGSQLRERVEAYRRGETTSFNLEETRAIVQRRLSSHP